MRFIHIARGTALIAVLLASGCNLTTPVTPVTNRTDTYTQAQTQPVEALPSTISMPSTAPATLPSDQISHKQIHIVTAKGDIVFALFDETAPITVSNFVTLTNNGFYNGLTFHRREEGFVIQGGDPNGDGTGGPGYTIPDELNDDYGYERGIVAMAKRPQPDTGGSQFFIMLANVPLPKEYTIFGKVTQGMDVVDAIAVGDVMTLVTVEAQPE